MLRLVQGNENYDHHCIPTDPQVQLIFIHDTTSTRGQRSSRVHIPGATYAKREEKKETTVT